MENCNSCPPGRVPYTIRSGDTLWAIAAGYGTTVDEILAVNEGLDPDRLSIGQKICLPFTGERYPMCRTGNYYIVRGNITFERIARYFGVSTDMLLENNLGIDPNALYDGQILCIPVAPSPVRVEVGGGILRVRHKNGRDTWCEVEGSLDGESCVISKQIDSCTTGARALTLSDGSIVSGRSSGCEGLKVSDSDMASLFNLVPVGTAFSPSKE